MCSSRTRRSTGPVSAISPRSGRPEADLALRLQVDVRRVEAPRLDDEAAAGQDEGDLARQIQGRPGAEAKLSGSEGEAAGEGAVAAHVQAALEIGEVRLHRHPLVVEEDLSALDHQALEPDVGPASLPTAEGRQVVASGLVGVDAHPRRLEAQLAQGERAPPHLGQARDRDHPGDLEERRVLGLLPRHAQAAPPRREGGTSARGPRPRRRRARRRCAGCGRAGPPRRRGPGAAGRGGGRTRGRGGSGAGAGRSSRSPEEVLLQDDEERSRLHGLALAHRGLQDAPGPGRAQLVLHLHGLHHHQALRPPPPPRPGPRARARPCRAWAP